MKLNLGKGHRGISIQEDFEWSRARQKLKYRLWYHGNRKHFYRDLDEEIRELLQGTLSVSIRSRL